MSKDAIGSSQSPQVRLHCICIHEVVSAASFWRMLRTKTANALQGKLKRLQEHDIDLEAGSSKKKLVTSEPEYQQTIPVQPQKQGAATEKPSFKVIGHFVMAMKRFQGLHAVVVCVLPAYTTKSGHIIH